MTNVAAASELLKPFDARLRRCYTVSTRINSVVNDDEECSARGTRGNPESPLNVHMIPGREYGVRWRTDDLKMRVLRFHFSP